MSDAITDPALAIAEAIRTGKPVEVRREDGSVRVVVSVPGAEEPSDAAVVVLADAVDALTKRLAAAEKERDELRARLDRFMSSAEIQLRHPDCDCHQEIGDSPCIVHGLDEADRIAKGTNRE